MTEAAPIRPIKLAHVVLKTSRFAEIVAWYKQALSAEAAFENDMIAFLTYDDEHHRIAVLNIPGLGPRQAGASGVHHIAFTFGSLGDLLGTFERLDKKGIKPVFCTNHGPTTCLLYTSDAADE